MYVNSYMHLHNTYIYRYIYTHILKSRDITLPTKVHIVKAMVLPVVMDECKSWNIKKDEH